MYNKEDGIYQLEMGTVKEGFIAIASGKGGVGKSTVTANLAVALSQAGKKIGIIDADIRGFSISRILGVTERPKAEGESIIIPPEKMGIKVMSMGGIMEEEKAIIWRGPLLNKTLEQFVKEVKWGELDYLLFDLPPGTGDMPLNVMQQLPDSELLVVTTPQVAATKVAGRVAKMAEQLNCNLLGVIENMSYYKCAECGAKEYIFGQGGGAELAANLNTELLAEFPLVAEVREGSDKGNPIVTANPESEISKKFMGLAEKIIKT
ncbi:MAG: Mrp/NBP35 family ATP-binding protein [Bacillota bacterium]